MPSTTSLITFISDMIFEGQFIIKVNHKIYYITKFLQSNIKPAMIHMVLIVSYMPSIRHHFTFINI